MKIEATATAIYALLVLIGGVVGYLTVQSLPSLIMGSSFGTLLGLSAWGIYKDVAIAKGSAIALTILLLAFFGYRFTTTLKLFPAGVMSLASALLLLFFIFKR